jgi:16S rRNA (uracil1498-N3)-methyltransferase
MRQLRAYECHTQARAHSVRLTRVFIDGALNAGGLVELTRDTAAHLVKVLRARSGDELVLFNGDGREYSGTIEAVRGSRVSAAIGAARSFDRESPFRLTLVQCVPRGDRMDFIVQKATELGVVRIVPVLSQRSVVRLDAEQTASKQAHWRAVAVSACEQCGRNRLPAVEAPQPLLGYLGALEPREISGEFLRLVLEPERASRASAAAQTIDVNDSAAIGAQIAIGPEGGFAPEELEAFDLSDFGRLGLGPRVLRTETAAIAAIAVLQAQYGDMSVNSHDSSRIADS